MKFTQTNISGLYLVDLDLKADERGYFARIFCEKEFSQIGVDFKVVQASQSLTKQRGTLRGMHFQKEPQAEDKIVRCIRGAVYDVAIDLRKNSPTFGQGFSQGLSEADHKMIFIPKGFAHGFQALKNDSVVEYLMSEFYSAEQSFGVRWNDPLFNITWPIVEPLLSEKDKNWPLMQK